MYFYIRSFSEIKEPTELKAKCQELCQILAEDMQKERIKVNFCAYSGDL